MSIMFFFLLLKYLMDMDIGWYNLPFASEKLFILWWVDAGWPFVWRQYTHFNFDSGFLNLFNLAIHGIFILLDWFYLVMTMWAQIFSIKKIPDIFISILIICTMLIKALIHFSSEREDLNEVPFQQNSY